MHKRSGIPLAVASVFIAVAAILPHLTHSEYVRHLMVLCCFYVVAAESVNLIIGYMGQVSLGQQAMLGVGAYCSGLLAIHLGVPSWLGVAAAAFLGFVLNAAVGWLTLRLRSGYFVIVSVAIAEVLRYVALNVDHITGGSQGLGGIPGARLPLVGHILEAKIHYYYLGLLLVVLSTVVCQRLVGSRAGRAIIALRENENLALSLGIDLTYYRVGCVAIAGAIAGAAGSFYAHYVRLVSPDLLGFNYAVTLLLMVVLGGRGTIAGPVVGGIVCTILPEFLRIATVWRWIIYGLLLIGFVLVIPKGLVPLGKRVALWIRGRRTLVPPQGVNQW